MVKRPTETELALLRVLWKRGPSTVREVHTDLGYPQTTGYTTTLKLLQIMAEKGLVVRDETSRAHVYAAAETEQRTLRQLTVHLVDRAFGGSAAKLVMQALAGATASKEELVEIRRLLDGLEERE